MMSQDPETDYERMLERCDLDCSIYACWEPIRAFIRVQCGCGEYEELGVCAEHAKGRDVTRWLES